MVSEFLSSLGQIGRKEKGGLFEGIRLYDHQRRILIRTGHLSPQGHSWYFEWMSIGLYYLLYNRMNGPWNTEIEISFLRTNQGMDLCLFFGFQTLQPLRDWRDLLSSNSDWKCLLMLLSKVCIAMSYSWLDVKVSIRPSRVRETPTSRTITRAYVNSCKERLFWSKYAPTRVQSRSSIGICFIAPIAVFQDSEPYSLTVNKASHHYW